MWLPLAERYIIFCIVFWKSNEKTDLQLQNMSGKPQLSRFSQFKINPQTVFCTSMIKLQTGPAISPFLSENEEVL